MAVARRRIGARRKPLVVLGVVVIAGAAGSFGPSSASPIARSEHAVRPATAVVAGLKAGVAAADPGLRLPDPPALGAAVVGLASTARSDRAKLIIKVPATFAAAYIGPTYRNPTGGIPVPKYYLPKHPLAQCNYYYTPFDSDLYAVAIDQPDTTKPGVLRSVGQFPDTKVAALAFGSIPVTATLHAQQVVRNGKIVPITADTVQTYLSVLKSDPDGANGTSGCDLDWENGDGQPPFPTFSHGQLDITVSDLRVDNQPVDVGTNCHPVTPVQLNLVGEAPLYQNIFSGGTLIQQQNDATVTKAGNTYPLYPGSTNLTIPRFTGCVSRVTGEDVSRLLTAFVSGPANTLAVTQTQAVINNISTSNPSLCYGPNDGATGCATLPKNPIPPLPGK